MADTCASCLHLDLNDTKWGEYYCSKCSKYMKTNDHCSDFLDRNKALNASSSGYQRSGCYITTIICEILGYPDDADILQTLRGFRENYLKRNACYYPLLHEYDQVGPMIADAIHNESSTQGYSFIYGFATMLLQNFLLPCTLAIKVGNAEEAIAIYVNMVNMLKERYGLTSTQVDLSLDTPFEDLGKARRRSSILYAN